jgi:alpha-ketoglutarate-dependent taurine dioxygenase
LLIGRQAYDITGLAKKESEKLLRERTDFVSQVPRLYLHSWTVGDAILSDNRCLMHRAYPWDFSEAREMWLARIAGNPETESGSTVSA